MVSGSKNTVLPALYSMLAESSGHILSTLSELSRDEFLEEVEKDQNFGVAVLLHTGVISPEIAANLNERQKELSRNYKLLKLLGCKIGYSKEARGRRYDLGLFCLWKHYDDGAALSIEDFLNLDPEKCNILEDQNIFKLVYEKTISIERMFALTEKEFERLRVKSEDERNDGLKSYFSYFITKSKFESGMAFLLALPDDYWPSRDFVFDAMKYCDSDDALQDFAKLPVELLKFMEGKSDCLCGLIMLTRPEMKLVYDASASGYVEAVVRAPLGIKDYALYDTGQVHKLSIAYNVIKKGYMTFHDVLWCSEDEARKAVYLQKIIDDYGLNVHGEGDVSKEITRADIERYNLEEVQQLWALGALIKAGAITQDQALTLGHIVGDSYKYIQDLLKRNIEIVTAFFDSGSDEVFDAVCALDADTSYELFWDVVSNISDAQSEIKPEDAVERLRISVGLQQSVVQQSPPSPGL